MASGRTSRKELIFPKPTDNDTLCADQQAAAEKLDTLNEGQQDFLQAGVVKSTDWSFTATINSGTGAIGSSAEVAESVAWLPDPVVSGALMRSVTAKAALSGIAPSLLPASGKYVSCAFELTPSTWGAKATVTAHSGVEKNTEAEAIAAPPATTAGKIQVREVIIKNTAGVYSVVAQVDRRAWVATSPWEALALGTEITSINPTARVRSELAGSVFRLTGRVENSSGKTLVHGFPLATVPVGFRPPQSVRLFATITGPSTEAIVPMTIQTTGILAVNAELESGHEAWFMGTSYTST